MFTMLRRLTVLATLACTCTAPLIATASASAAPPPIGHVWVVVLENTSYAESFGPDAKAPYFSRDLPAQGALLTQYHGTTHFSLGNYVAMLSGQPSNPETQADCLNYSDFKGGVDVGNGVLAGTGCVYPASVRTLADQLRAKGLTNKGYLQDMANGGLVAADAFLQRTIPGIMASPAFQKNGLILLTFDEAEASGTNADSSSCCNQPAGPNTPSPGGVLTPGPGGGRIGAIALSRFVKPGTTSTVPYNHYSLLRSLEETFGISEHLGYANELNLATFGDDVYSSRPGTTKLPLPGMTPPVQSPPVVPTCGTTTVKRRRITKGDLVQSVVVSDPISGNRFVQVRMAHGARLTVRQVAGGKTRTLAKRVRVRACRQYRYRLRLPGTGRLQITASVPTGAEKRTTRYR
jgi:hypothetical protein